MYAYGIDIGGTSVKAGLIKDNAVEKRLIAPTPRSPEDLAELVIELLGKLGWKDGPAPVGIDVPGGISPDGLVYADNLGWQKGIPFGAILERIGCKAKVINDASAALIAEAKIGALAGIPNSLLITFGTGIGSGAIIHGKPYDGFRKRGIELGHIITHADGLPCPCGQKGCWELYASASALSRFCGGLPVKEIIAGTKEGRFQSEWSAYLTEVAIGMCSCLSAFAPEKVALGGGLSGSGEYFLNAVKAALVQTPGYTRLYDKIEICLAKAGNDAGMIGSAIYATEQ